MIMTDSIQLLNFWLAEEQQAGAPNPKQAVLSTCAKDGQARLLQILSTKVYWIYQYHDSFLTSRFIFTLIFLVSSQNQF